VTVDGFVGLLYHAFSCVNFDCYGYYSKTTFLCANNKCLSCY